MVSANIYVNQNLTPNFCVTGFLKDDFHAYMMAEAGKRSLKVVFENQKKFVLCHSTSAHKHALDEILADAKMAGVVANTKVSSRTWA